MMNSKFLICLVVVVVASNAVLSAAFVAPSAPTSIAPAKSTALFAEQEGGKKGGFFGAVSNFFEELDAFVDDASMRRLGAGAKFYGKRKSSFYGEQDSMKKADRNKSDPTEDYRITAAGNYKLVEDEDGVLRPVSRRKNVILDNLGR